MSDHPCQSPGELPVETDDGGCRRTVLHHTRRDTGITGWDRAGDSNSSPAGADGPLPHGCGRSHDPRHWRLHPGMPSCSLVEIPKPQEEMQSRTNCPTTHRSETVRHICRGGRPKSMESWAFSLCACYCSCGYRSFSSSCHRLK